MANQVTAKQPTPEAIKAASLETLPKGQTLYRVHLDQYEAEQFNPGVKGNARFSPIKNENMDPIPTLYAATTMECALMETVFHDVPYTPGFKSFDKTKLDRQVASTLTIEEDLKVVDLSNVKLRRMGVQRAQLIDTEKDQYPVTRQWAEALHKEYPDAQGLSWVSRQDDSATAIMLFGDRISSTTLSKTDNSRSLVNDDDTYKLVIDLADKIGVSIVPGKS